LNLPQVCGQIKHGMLALFIFVTFNLPLKRGRIELAAGLRADQARDAGALHFCHF
jgi:hypothetical protein